MRKKEAATDEASEWSSAAVAGRITPLDVQQKEFHVTRVGAGYRMREVDEFLDQVTDALSALIAENERLLRGAGASSVETTARETPPTTASDETDRAAVEAFLRREKGFLEDLGGLVQAHAEELRSMVRAVRSDVSTKGAAPGAAPAAPAAAAPIDPAADVSAAAPAADVLAPESAPEPAAADPGGTIEEAGPTSEVERDEPAPEIPDDGGSRTPVAITGDAAEQPIQLEEPEPARARRSDEEGDSLRELFWGEE
jgi:DivIVA domain-containing protein